MSTEQFLDEFGPTALITGAASGIGRSFATLLARRGMRLVVVDLVGDRLRELAAELHESHGTDVQILEADLSDAAAPDRIVQETAGIDIGLVISNAGTGFKGPHERNESQALTDLLMVNCNAGLVLSRGFIPRLRARGRGGLIFTASVEGLIGGPYSAAYAASKAFMVSLGEGLWGELTPAGIKVLTLCPGATDTEMMVRQRIDVSKIRGLMSPDEVAQVTLDNIDNGPTFISSAHYEKQFAGLLSMPRRDALSMMAKMMASTGN